MTTAATGIEQDDRRSAAERAEGCYAPLTNINESDDAFIFCAELPGVKPGDVDASFDDGILTIHGKAAPRQPPEQEYALREYGVADYHRTFALGAPVAAERITAVLRDGVLTVTVPKSESARRRKIEVKTV
jgi:HSP20 family protein